jgi:hypothetical protein
MRKQRPSLVIYRLMLGLLMGFLPLDENCVAQTQSPPNPPRAGTSQAVQQSLIFLKHKSPITFEGGLQFTEIRYTPEGFQGFGYKILTLYNETRRTCLGYLCPADAANSQACQGFDSTNIIHVLLNFGITGIDKLPALCSAQKDVSIKISDTSYKLIIQDASESQSLASSLANQMVTREKLLGMIFFDGVHEVISSQPGSTEFSKLAKPELQTILSESLKPIETRLDTLSKVLEPAGQNQPNLKKIAFDSFWIGAINLFALLLVVLYASRAKGYLSNKIDELLKYDNPNIREMLSLLKNKSPDSYEDRQRAASGNFYNNEPGRQSTDIRDSGRAYPHFLDRGRSNERPTRPSYSYSADETRTRADESHASQASAKLLSPEDLEKIQAIIQGAEEEQKSFLAKKLVVHEEFLVNALKRNILEEREARKLTEELGRANDEINDKRETLYRLAEKEGFCRDALVRYLPYLQEEPPLARQFRQIMLSLLQEAERTDDASAEIRAFCAIDEFAKKLKEYAPFAVIEFFRDDPGKSFDERLRDYSIFNFNDLIQRIFRIHALLAAYYPDFKNDPLTLAFGMAEQGMRAILARLGIYPDYIRLLAPRNPEHEQVVQHTEPECVSSHPRFKEKLRPCLQNQENLRLVTDVRLWGYTDKNGESQKTEVYTRDHASLP